VISVVSNVPVPFALLVGFALGALLAEVARPVVVRDDEGHAFPQLWAVVLGFTFAAFAPAVAYPVCFHGDWAYLYLVPWRDVPASFDVLAVALAVATVPFGFALGLEAVLRRRVDRLRLYMAVPAVLAVLLFVVARQRLCVSATYAQLRGGFGTEPLAASVLGRALLFFLGILVMGMALAVRGFRR